jgi:hypothetical protein
MKNEIYLDFPSVRDYMGTALVVPLYSTAFFESIIFYKT